MFLLSKVSGLTILGRFFLYIFINSFTVHFHKVFNKQLTWMISELNLDSKCAALSASVFSSNFFILTVAAQKYSLKKFNSRRSTRRLFYSFSILGSVYQPGRSELGTCTWKCDISRNDVRTVMYQEIHIQIIIYYFRHVKNIFCLVKEINITLCYCCIVLE